MDRLALYQNLPSAVREYLFDSAAEARLAEALRHHALNEDTLVDVVMLADDVVLQLLPLEGLQKKIIEVAQVEPATAEAIAKDVIGWRLLPLKEFLPDIEAEAKRLQVDPSAYPAEAIKKPKVTPETFLREVLSQIGVTFDKPELTNRLEFLLNSYLRGVRTKEQIVSTMGRSVKVGGLEMSETRATEILAAIDEKKGEISFDSAPFVEAKSLVTSAPQAASELAPLPIKSATPLPENVQSFKQLMAAERQRQEAERALLAEQDKADLAKRYASLTGKVPTTTHPSLESRGDSLASVSLAVSKREELAKSAAKHDETAKAVLRQAAPRPTPVLPKLSQPSVPPSQAGERPQVADVKYIQKLVGPIEELKTMTLVDFHRMGSDPDQVVMKIQDKIDLLKGEAYEKMIQGVKAWKESAVYRLYVAMSGEALRTGKPIETISNEWKAQGKETLTAAEVKAIVRLNTSLRF